MVDNQDNSLEPNISCLVCGGTDIDEVVVNNRRYFYCHTCKKRYSRIHDDRYGSNVSIASGAERQHVVVVALVRHGNRFLLTKRRMYVFGYHFPAGHVKYGESPDEAIRRETLEETGLDIPDFNLIYEVTLKGAKCRYGADTHLYFLYECTAPSETIFVSQEHESLSWFTVQEARDLPLIPVARYLFDNVVAPRLSKKS